MFVDRISTLEKLELIRLPWNELHDSDSAADLFLSWEWVTACINAERKSWLILGVRDEERYIAFLPLRFIRFPAHGPVLTRELSLGLSAHVDFTGMLGVAGEESRFLPELAREIRSMTWDTFTLNNCADHRIGGLVRELSARSFRVVSREPTPCPYVALPDNWDEYLRSRGKSTRRTIRARLNKLKSLPGYHLHLTPPREAEAAIDALLTLHGSRWKKDRRRSRAFFRELLRSCYASGNFQIFAMYHGAELMATHGFFVDGKRRTVLGYMIAFSPRYAEYSPGMMLGCASIRCAIGEGYDRFSLSRGAQGYKMSLATDVEYITNTLVSRRSARAAAVGAVQGALSSTKRLARRLFSRSAPPRGRGQHQHDERGGD